MIRIRDVVGDRWTKKWRFIDNEMYGCSLNVHIYTLQLLAPWTNEISDLIAFTLI